MAVDQTLTNLCGTKGDVSLEKTWRHLWIVLSNTGHSSQQGRPRVYVGKGRNESSVKSKINSIRILALTISTTLNFVSWSDFI